MSKVVTIPKDRNPFIVIVNGVEYKYPAGATIEVPDSVADVIEKYEGAKPKPDPNHAPGGNSGGSVQTDWNQTDSSAADFIKNKPFGETPVVILEEQVLSDYDESEGGYIAELTSPVKNDDVLVVLFEGQSYECKTFDNLETILFGNFVQMGCEDTGEPFIGAIVGTMLIFVPFETKNPTVKITLKAVSKIPERYYTGATLFYTDGTYLYMDSACTTKATSYDVKKAINNGSVAISMLGAALIQPCAINLATYEYAIVACMNLVSTDELDTKILFTAEYVPET